VREDVRAERERNHSDNLAHVDWYVDWVRRTPNDVWSEQQRRFIDSVIRSSRDFRARCGYVSAERVPVPRRNNPLEGTRT